ncbi:MAG: carbohydrate binding domain-containing protein, partial [Lentisphaeria bacterium]|nr:carbohydrate binding domain-containing protein [Lentisphaeria bacterium]
MKTISSIVLLAGLTLFLDGQEPNLIKNPGFTAGTNWWYNSPIFSIAKENNNRYFRIVSATEVKPVFAEQTPPIPVEAGKSYEFSCRFKSMLKSGEVYFMFLVRDAGNRCIRILNSPKITEKTGSEWETLRYVFVVPEKGTVIQIRIYAGMSFSGEVQLDDLVLKEGNGELK